MDGAEADLRELIANARRVSPSEGARRRKVGVLVADVPEEKRCNAP